MILQFLPSFILFADELLNIALFDRIPVWFCLLFSSLSLKRSLWQMQITVISLRWINGCPAYPFWCCLETIWEEENFEAILSVIIERLTNSSLVSQVMFWSFLLRCWRLLQNFDLFSIYPLIFLLFSWGWGFRRTDWLFLIWAQIHQGSRKFSSSKQLKWLWFC